MNDSAGGNCCEPRPQARPYSTPSSRTSTVQDQPSQTMWWAVISNRWSSAASCNSSQRNSPPCSSWNGVSSWCRRRNFKAASRSTGSRELRSTAVEREIDLFGDAHALAVRAEAGTKRIMPLHQRPERLAERVDVQRAAQAQGFGQVEREGSTFPHAVAEPDFALRFRGRNHLLQVAAREWVEVDDGWPACQCS